jgi:hypothetical protein
MDFIRARRVVVHGEQDNIVLDGPGKRLELRYGTDLVQESLNGVDQSVHRADSAGRILQTKDSGGNWVTREEITGGVDVAEHRIRNSVVKIIPASAGADALVIRDYANSVDRLKIKEDGYVYGSRLSFGEYIDAAGKVWLLVRTTGVDGIQLTAVDARIIGPNGLGIGRAAHADMEFRPRGIRINASVSYADIIFLAPSDASSTSPLQNSIRHIFRALYWDGTMSVSRDAAIFHRMISTTPTSELAFQIGGVDYLRVGDRGVKLDKVVFDTGSSVSIVAGGTYTLPVGVWYVNLGLNTVAEVYDDVAGTWVTIIPAGGKGIVVSDGSNARLRNTGTVAEASNIRRVL